MKQYFASDFAYGIAPNVSALKVGVGSTTTGAATSYVLYESQCVSSTPSQESFYPLATNTPVLVGSGTIQETLTPSAVTNLPVGQSSTVSFSTTTNAHGNGSNLASGTVGLQEALNFLSLSGNGGEVVVDGRWAQLGGTSAMLAAAANPTGSAVYIADKRGAEIAYWNWDGSAFVPSGGLGVVLYAASGAISIADQTAVITKSSGVAVMTLAAPTAAQEGTEIVVTSRTSQAHTITATSLINDGVTGAPHTTATFAAFPGASITLVADNLLWNVISSNHVTIS